MVDLGFYAESLQKRDSAEAKDGFLAEAIVGVAAVEVVGKLTVPGVIALDVGVEEEDRNDVSGGSDDVEAPGTDVYLTVLQSKRDGLTGAGQGLGRPGDVDFGLLAQI
jgi:hypothetical protein